MSQQLYPKVLVEHACHYELVKISVVQYNLAVTLSSTYLTSEKLEVGCVAAED